MLRKTGCAAGLLIACCMTMMMFAGCNKNTANDVLTPTIPATTSTSTVLPGLPGKFGASDLETGDIRFFADPEDMKTLLGEPKSRNELTEEATGTVYERWEYEDARLEFMKQPDDTAHPWALARFMIEREGIAGPREMKINQPLDEILQTLPLENEYEGVGEHIFYRSNTQPKNDAISPYAWLQSADSQTTTLVLAFPYPDTGVKGEAWIFEMHIVMTLTIQDGKVKKYEGFYGALAE